MSTDCFRVACEGMGQIYSDLHLELKVNVRLQVILSVTNGCRKKLRDLVSLVLRFSWRSGTLFHLLLLWFFFFFFLWKWTFTMLSLQNTNKDYIVNRRHHYSDSATGLKNSPVIHFSNWRTEGKMDTVRNIKCVILSNSVSVNYMEAIWSSQQLGWRLMWRLSAWSKDTENPWLVKRS